MKKKIFSLTVVIILLISMTFVLAEDVGVNSVPCKLCGGTIVSSIEYSPWDYVLPSTIRKCEHYTFGCDQKQYRIKSYNHDCLECSYSVTHNVTTEYKWLCFGFK